MNKLFNLVTINVAARMFLPPPFKSTGDISAYITQFGFLCNLQNWLGHRKIAKDSPESDDVGIQRYTDKSQQIWSIELRARAIEYHHSMDDDTRNNWKRLRNAFEKKILNIRSFLRSNSKKNSRQVFADLKIVARRAYLDDVCFGFRENEKSLPYDPKKCKALKATQR